MSTSNNPPDPGLLTPEPPKENPPPAPTGLPEWSKVKEALPEDLRNDPSLGPITDITALAKSYVHAQKTIGKDKIVIPDSKYATPEDWQSVFRKLGNPEKIDDYGMDLGEDLSLHKEILDKVKTVAHQKGILPWQLTEVIKAMDSTVKEMATSKQTEYESQITEQVNELKKAWGNEFDTQVKRANAAMRHFLPEQKDQEAFISQVGASNPAVIRLLANAAKLLTEDDLLGQGEGNLAGITPEDALKRAREIQGNREHPYRNPAHPGHKDAKEEVKRLYEIAFPQ